MRKLGLAVCLTLVSGFACAGSIEIPINGGVGRLHIDETCTDRLCGTASWTDQDTGQTFEFALPNVSWKDIEALTSGSLSGGSPRKSARPEKSNKAAAPATQPAAKSAASPAKPSEVTKPETAAPPALAAAPPMPNAEPPASAAAATPSVSADAPAKPAAPESKLAAIPSPPPAPAPASVATAAPASGPVGLWMTEKQEGMVRVEPCGQAICGYEVNAKTQQNGKKVLIDMRPSGKSWKGRIHDPRGGGTYDSTVSMKGKDAMRVEGCALGGLFCGGQTWSRVN